MCTYCHNTQRLTDKIVELSKAMAQDHAHRGSDCCDATKSLLLRAIWDGLKYVYLIEGEYPGDAAYEAEYKSAGGL